MPDHAPPPLSFAQLRARQLRVLRVARSLGFVGRVVYRHVYSQSGGAQYGLAVSPPKDLLMVYAEAFDRDRNPRDFSLEAIIAHERGHQLVARHRRIAREASGRLSLVGEEFLASVLGAIISPEQEDEDVLLAKAAAELLARGERPETAMRVVATVRKFLERLL